MAIAQSEFNLFRGRGYEAGIHYRSGRYQIPHRDWRIHPYGRAVVRGPEKRSCAPVSASSKPEDIIGFTVRSMAEASPTPPSENAEYAIGYPVDHVASVMHRGPMYALCVDGAKGGDAVVVITKAGKTSGGSLLAVMA